MKNTLQNLKAQKQIQQTRQLHVSTIRDTLTLNSFICELAY